MSKRAEELAGALIALVQPWGGTGIEDQRERFSTLIDAELRKERERCAERAREDYCKTCEQYGLHDRVNDPCPAVITLRAPILADE